MKNTLIKSLIVVAIIALITTVLYASSQRDIQSEQANQIYEACVLEQYGMTVYQVIDRIGEQPVCVK